MPVRELAPEEEVFPIEVTKGAVRELRAGEEEFEQRFGPLERGTRAANVGLAELLGAPLDVATETLNLGARGLTAFGNIFLDPSGQTPEQRLKAPQINPSILGGENIRRAFSALGLTPPPGEEDPETLAGSVGRVTGAAVEFLLPVGPAAKAATAVKMGIRAAPTTVRGAIVQDIGRAAVEKPGRFAAIETVSGALAGAGGFIARERFPDSEAASVIGEIAGGLTPAGAILAVKTLPAIILARTLAKPFTKPGGAQRARRRIQEAARDPERAAEELAAGEVLPGAELTPAQLAGDEGLLSLERSVIESSEQLTGQADEQIAQATRAIRESLGGLGEDVSPERTATTLVEARNYIQSLMDTRMRIAARRADERIVELAPNATREDANIIAREEIVAAREAINDQVRELWDAVPESVILKTKNSRKTFAKLLKETPLAQRDDVPSVAGRLLGRDEDVPEGFEAAFEAFGLGQKGGRLGKKTTVKELQGLRSKLLEEGRIARAAGQSNKARIADELAEAVLADLGAQRDEATGEAGEALRAALDATAHMKNTFDKGAVGRILATDRRGAPITPEALTLETTVGKGGPRARVETQAVLEAADTPAIRGAVEDFLLDDLERRAIREGRIDGKKAQAFLLRHEDVLEDFPELRSRIEGAIETGETAALAAGRAEGLAKRLADPKVSRAAVFLKEPVEGAMERIAKSPKPEKTMREIVKQASRDTTGDATKGIKTAFGDFLLQRATKGTAAGDFISGRTLKNLLKDGPVTKMAKTLFSPDEQRRLAEIADVAEKIEKAVAAKAKPGAIIGDLPSLMANTVARVMGAQVGRQIATVTGGGTVQTPGIIAGLFQRVLNSARAKVQDPARRILLDALGDKKLFETLLRGGLPPTDKKFIRKQLNAWLLSIGAEQIGEEE